MSCEALFFLLPIHVGQPHKLNFMLLACLMSHARKNFIDLNLFYFYLQWCAISMEL